MDHWAKKYIGKPWVKDGQGPDAFNCWGFVRFVFKEQCGVYIPEVDVDAMSLLAVVRTFKSKELHADWEKQETPQDMDGVELSHAKDPHHVGIWLDVDGGGVLHCVKGIGVMFSSVHNLRLSGWNIRGFWRHKCKLQ